MTITAEEAIEAQQKYIQKYRNGAPHNKYVWGVGVSILRVRKDGNGDTFYLRQWESPDNHCLGIFLREEPPKGLFPSEFEGVRVFYNIVPEEHY